MNVEHWTSRNVILDAPRALEWGHWEALVMDCYCSTDEPQIIADINREAVPADALTEDHCWRTICRTRGYYYSEVDEDAWRRVCAERGYLMSRQNPRGF